MDRASSMICFREFINIAELPADDLLFDIGLRHDLFFADAALVAVVIGTLTAIVSILLLVIRSAACRARNFEKPAVSASLRTLNLLQKVTSMACGARSVRTTFDDRAFEINDEITMGFLNASLARELELIFEHDLKDCVKLNLDSWFGRSVFSKLKDHILYFLRAALVPLRLAR